MPIIVLIADDNTDAADSLALMVELHGHRAVVAYDGLSAVDLAREHCPQLVILDVHMPGLTGLQAAEAIRGECARPMLLAALTGVQGPQAVQRARHAGFDAFFVKPIDADDVYALVARARALAAQ